jgi:hypothetical protein
VTSSLPDTTASAESLKLRFGSILPTGADEELRCQRQRNVAVQILRSSRLIRDMAHDRRWLAQGGDKGGI